MANWFYIGHYGQLGPLTREQVDELIEGGVISLDTYVWQTGMSEWVMAKDVPQLQDSLKKSAMLYAVPPPAPDTFTYSQVGSHATNYPSANYSLQTAYDRQYPVGLPKSPKSRVAAGVLNILLPGVGRMYLGYHAVGVMQLVLTLCTGFLYLWALIDGIIMLTGGVKHDGYGRALGE